MLNTFLRTQVVRAGQASHIVGEGAESPRVLVFYLCHHFSCPLPYPSTGFSKNSNRLKIDSFFLKFNVSSVECNHLAFGALSVQ